MAQIFDGHILRLPQRSWCILHLHRSFCLYAKRKPDNKHPFQVLLLECLSLNSNLRTRCSPKSGNPSPPRSFLLNPTFCRQWPIKFQRERCLQCPCDHSSPACAPLFGADIRQRRLFWLACSRQTCTQQRQDPPRARQRDGALCLICRRRRSRHFRFVPRGSCCTLSKKNLLSSASLPRITPFAASFQCSAPRRCTRSATRLVALSNLYKVRLLTSVASDAHFVRFDMQHQEVAPAAGFLLLCQRRG
jgi:hypothetical protein